MQRLIRFILIASFVAVGFATHVSADGSVAVSVMHSHIGGELPHHHDSIPDDDDNDDGGPVSAPHAHEICLTTGFVLHFKQTVFLPSMNNVLQAFPEIHQDSPPRDPNLDSIFRPPILA